MSELKRISPMLDNYDIGSSISEHDGVRCFPAMRKDSDDRYIVKAVSIPTSQTQLDALLLTGAFPDAASALNYFKELADQTVEEIEILHRLSQLEGFLPYESWQISAKDDAIGFDVCMLSPYKRTLRKHLQKQPMTHLGAVNLGLDMCAALAVCRRSGYLYVDLKPNNIYVIDEQQFRIGDIGFIDLNSLAYASVPDRYRSEYTAPEIQDAFATLNTTIDIYALGLILYQVYNGGALPSNNESDSKEKFPAPMNADYEMAEIILKACDPDPESRWQDPIQMGQALISYMQRNGANNTPIMPPIIPVVDDIDLSDIDLSDVPDIETFDDDAISTDDHKVEDVSASLEDNAPEEVTADKEIAESAEETAPEESPADVDITEFIEEPVLAESPADSETTEVAEDITVINNDISIGTAEISIDETDADSADLEDVVAITAEIEVNTPEHSEEAVVYDEDSFGNLSFLDVLPEDETSPENNVDDVQYEDISAELSRILEQADELVSHPVPEPVVAPEPIDIVIPEPEKEQASQSDQETSSEESTSASAEEATESNLADDVSADDDSHTSDTSLAETVIIPTQNKHVPSVESDVVPEIDEEDDADDQQPVKKKSSALKWILNTIIILLILAILAVGFFYYKNIYLLPIDSISVNGNESSMVVNLSSNIDESLLSVVCSDSHGNQISAPVVNGSATFANLAPDTAYTIQILVDGFHRLTGATAASYSTPAQTNIVLFSAITGTEDGSVILSFNVEGPDNGEWSIIYSAEGEPEQTVELLSHMITLSDLTIGKEYTFTLVPGDDMYVTGQTELTFVASELIYAQDVSIVSCINNHMTVNWSAPDSSSITEWTVRCYDDADYNETVITADTTAVFENVDATKSHTVEVTAAGMSVSQRAYMAENPITITNFQADTSSSKKMVLTWESSHEVPDDGWVLLYTVDNSTIQSSVLCTDNRAEISPIVPDANYTFTLQQTNGDVVLSAPLTCHTSKAQDFSGYGMIRASMTYKLCNRPEDADWDHSDISDSDYTNTFKVGEDISIVGQLHDTYGTSEDNILTLYVFRDKDGNVVSYSYTESPWKDMWYKYYGEFDIPQAPSIAGEYTLSIYFNGKLVTNKNVTIQE